MTGRNPSQTHNTLPRSTSNPTAPSVRRHIFGPRRPQANSNNPSASSSAQAGVHTDSSASKEDIIIRDETGNYRLDLPNMAPLPRDEAKDDREVENRLIESYRKHQQHIDSNGTALPPFLTPSRSLSPHPPPPIPSNIPCRAKSTQKVKIMGRMVEHIIDPECTFCHYPKPSPKGYVYLSGSVLHANYSAWAELRASLQTSLQAKLESLDEDKWMFGEDDDDVPV